MATRNWLGVAAKVAQVETITVTGPIVIGETFTVTINGKSITFTATAGTIANVTAGLVALLNASTIAEFAEITWADASPDITATCDTAGLPFTLTVAETSAAGGISTATTTAATGPNHWNNANNWSGGAVPVTGDDVYVNLAYAPVYYGLGQSAVTLATLRVYSSGGVATKLGLPKTNAVGGYTEYRTCNLQIGATLAYIDAASSRIQIDFGSVQTTCEVSETGSAAEAGVPPCLLWGTHASNVVEVKSGSVGIGFYPGDTSTVLTLRVAAKGTVEVGSGVTLGTVESLGTIDVQCAATTIKVSSGAATISGSGAVGTLEVDGTAARVSYESSGTVTTANIGPGSVDCSADLSSRTFTTTTLRAGGRIIDPRRTITYTNGIARGTNVSEVSAA